MFRHASTALLAAAALTLASPALAEEAEQATKAAEAAKPKRPDPDAGFSRPDAPDLRSGHLLLSLSGGMWTPSKGLVPKVSEIGDLDLGGTAHAHIGLGLNRYLALQLDGGFANVGSSGTSCDSCGATSLDFGATMLLHMTQGFAVDPWVGIGMAYRHTMLSLELEDDRTLSGFDFLRLSLGGSFFPVPSFGFGPYMATDIGVRDFDDPTAYGIFHLGVKLTYDPMRTGVSFTPGVASAE